MISCGISNVCLNAHRWRRMASACDFRLKCIEGEINSINGICNIYKDKLPKTELNGDWKVQWNRVKFVVYPIWCWEWRSLIFCSSVSSFQRNWSHYGVISTFTLSLSAPFFFFFVFNLYLTNVVNNAQSHCNRIVNTYLHGVLYCEQFIYFQGGWWIKWIDETFFFYSLLFSSSFLRCVCAVAFFFSPVFFLFAFSAFFSSGLR